MNDPTTQFFTELESRMHEPLLNKARGTIRFDVVDGKRTSRWLVSIDRGKVAVSRRNASADAVVRVPRALFERLVAGQANAMAEVLRGTIVVKGEVEPVILFQRLFPGPSR